MPSLQISSAKAISFGCSKAQKDAEMYRTRAVGGQNLEKKYLKMGLYSDAYRNFQSAVNDYYYWNATVSKSPKCFKKDYVNKVKKALKSVSVNYTMATRYGLEIAKRNNYGSSDPCFKYLGNDEAYLNCSTSYASPDNPGYVD